MPNKRISTEIASKILKLYVLNGLNKTQIVKLLGTPFNTVIDYIAYYELSGVNKSDLLLLDSKTLIEKVFPISFSFYNQERSKTLTVRFPGFHERLKKGDTSLGELWAEYFKKEPFGYKYPQFAYQYNKWRRNNNFKRIRFNKSAINHIEPDDLKLLNKWRLSTDRNKWGKAVAILELYKGGTIKDISQKIEKSRDSVRNWAIVFKENGLENIKLRESRKTTDEMKKQMEKRSENIIKLLHEPPSLHNINRTSWSLKTLALAYKEHYGESICEKTISQYIRKKGYRFRKAKIVLTSPDPDYRAKLDNIKRILSGLKKNEKFFSIDEYGPIAIKAKGGRAYTPKDQLNTVPQIQFSKGRLICIAALELSKNQVTHFYSDKINTTEMIKLMMILLENYKTEDRIYFSSDAATWHASKALDKKVAEVNDPEYRRINATPFVELAPLPACAQFLNVIESVFSGMAKAIIHNSDYQSLDACKKAIDRHFAERNAAFTESPKRAGKKIWGEEVVKPIFTDSNTCKDPNFQ